MIHYSVSGVGDDRLLIVQKSQMQRFRFMQLHDNVQTAIKFVCAGSKMIASVKGHVMVYKVPKVNEYHREYMRHNARAMWCGMSSDPERVLNNMLEYHETL